jgi:hypothetical protein
MAKEILLGNRAKGAATVAPIHPDPDHEDAPPHHPDPDPNQVPVHPDPDPKEPPPIHPSHPGGEGGGEGEGNKSGALSYGIRKDENGEPTVVLDVD